MSINTNNKDNKLKVKELFRRIYYCYLLYRMTPLETYKQWKKHVWDRNLDELDCCRGYDCMCGGKRVRENYKLNFNYEQ